MQATRSSAAMSFSDVGLGSGLQGARDLVVGVVGREDDDAGAGIALADLPHQLDPFHHRHPQVDERDVGMVSLEGDDAVGAVAGLGDDFEIRLLVDDVGDARAQQRVIVHEQDRRLRRRSERRRLQPATWTCSGSADGSQASTTSVPPRGAVTIVSDAPIRSARSCMLVMPNPSE